jgi:hypothetical protein
MNVKKENLTQMAVVAVVSLCIVGAAAGAVSAATDTPNGNPMAGLVSAIASKFNLDASEVQAVFDGQKTKMDAEQKTKMAGMEARRQQQFSERLAKAVSDGKLAQAQANLIIAKKAEFEAAKTSLEGKTKEERRAAMEAQKESLKAWATANNIPDGYLPCQGRGMAGGHRGFGPEASDDSANAPSGN